MKLLNLVALLTLTTLTHTFITGCQKFNPMNFNECLKCNDNYYQVGTGCCICPPQPNNIADCQIAQTPPLQQSSSTLGSSNAKTQSSKIASDSTGSSSNSINPSSSVTTTSKPADSTQQQSTATASPTIKTASSSDQMSQLQLIMGLLPSNCAGFGFQANKITCIKCKDGYILTNGVACLKEETSKPISSSDSVNSQKQNSIGAIPTINTGISENTNTNSPADSSKQQNPQTSKIVTLSQLYQQSSVSQQVTQQTAQQQTTSQSTTNTIGGSATTIYLLNGPSNSNTQTPSKSPEAKFPSANAAQDLNCMQFNPKYSLNKPIGPQNIRCLACYSSFYYNITLEQCMPKNPLCKDCDSNNLCLSCYPGYILFNNNCQINSGKIPLIVSSSAVGSSASSQQPQKQAIQDPNCKEYNQDSAQCITCSGRYYPNQSNGICTQVDPSCQTWNSTTGICQSCYTGYITSQTNPKVCKRLSEPITTNSLITNQNDYKAYCINTKNNICTGCINRYFLFNGLCFPVSDQCKTYNSVFGYCHSCYDGYNLVDGVCSLQISAASKDPFCIVWEDGKCGQCIMNYFTGTNGVCSPVSALCNGYNKNTGHCTDCLIPYTLDNSSGECVYRYQ